MVKVKLLRPARVRHNTGETVTVSPEEADFLISVGSAERLKAETKGQNETEKKPKETK